MVKIIQRKTFTYNKFGTLALPFTVFEPNSTLVLLLGGLDPSPGIGTGATYNDSPFKQIVYLNEAAGVQTEILVLQNPPVGNHSLSITSAGTATLAVFLLEITGLDPNQTPLGFSAGIAGAANFTQLVPSPYAGGIIIDAFVTNGKDATPNNTQNLIAKNTNTTNFLAASFKVSDGKPTQSMVWNQVGAAGNQAYVAISLAANQAPQISNPSTNFPKKFPSATYSATTATSIFVEQEGVNYQTAFFENSFLHTIGRFPKSPPPVPIFVNGLFNSSRAIIDRITQNAQTSATSVTVDHLVSTKDAVLVIFASIAGVTESINALTLNGAPLTNLASGSVSTLAGGVYFVTNPRVGINTVSFNITLAASTQLIMMSLLGVDKRTQNPIVVANTGAAATPESTITPTAPNSLLIDYVGTLVGSGTENASQVQYFEQTQAASAAFGSIKLAGQAPQTMSWNTTGGAWIQFILSLEPAFAASMWNPNVDLRNLLDVIEPNGLDTTANPNGNFSRSTGNFPSTFWQNSFLHTVGRRMFNPTTLLNGAPSMMMMGVGM